MHVIYQGPAHFRVLNSADLQKAGVDGFRQTSFERGVPTEVPDNVGAALVGLAMYGNFAEVSNPNPEPVTYDGQLVQVDGDEVEVPESLAGPQEEAPAVSPEVAEGQAPAGQEPTEPTPHPDAPTAAQRKAPRKA